MRIKLKRRKQTELVNLAKVNRMWRELSDELDLSEGYVRNELRNEKTLLSEKAYEKLSNLIGEKYNKHVLVKIADNWGMVKGGKNSVGGGITKEINFPEDSEELAEFYGIMLGDGHLSKVKAYKVGTYEVRITGDSRHDKDFLLNFVKPLIEKLFEIDIKFYFVKNKNVLVIKAQGKRLVEFLELKGFKPRHKIKNRLGIFIWIKKDRDLLKSCLRGIYDTDGGIYKLNNRNTYQIEFTNHNRVLLEDVRDCLILLGMIPSKIVSGRRIYLTKKSELRKFLKQVGFRNSRHLDKVEMWNIAP